MFGSPGEFVETPALTLALSAKRGKTEVRAPDSLSRPRRRLTGDGSPSKCFGESSPRRRGPGCGRAFNGLLTDSLSRFCCSVTRLLAARKRINPPLRRRLVYRARDGEVLPARSKADWQKRRAEILQGFQQIAGPLPGREKRCALDARVEETIDCGSHERRLITYSSEPGARVPAYF